MRRKAQDELDHKLKYFKLFRWALIKQTREEMEEKKLEEIRKMKNAQRALKYGYARLLYAEIF